VLCVIPSGSPVAAEKDAADLPVLRSCRMTTLPIALRGVSYTHSETKLCVTSPAPGPFSILMLLKSCNRELLSP
jgi:hypothetical protein